MLQWVIHTVYSVAFIAYLLWQCIRVDNSVVQLIGFIFHDPHYHRQIFLIFTHSKTLDIPQRIIWWTIIMLLYHIELLRKYVPRLCISAVLISHNQHIQTPWTRHQARSRVWSAVMLPPSHRHLLEHMSPIIVSVSYECVGEIFLI